MFRKIEILVLVLTALTGFLSNSVLAKRGPHHPRSEPLGKVNEHIVHSDEHLKADLKASHLQPGKPVEEMTVEEKHFYHFKMHDYDNNNLLDGLELLQSTNAHHDESFHSHHTATGVTADHGAANKKQLSTDNEEEQGLQHLVDIIDDFLLVADKNNDGFLNFNEYKETLRDSHDEQGAGDYPPPTTDNDVVGGGGGGVDDNKL